MINPTADCPNCGMASSCVLEIFVTALFAFLSVKRHLNFSGPFSSIYSASKFRDLEGVERKADECVTCHVSLPCVPEGVHVPRTTQCVSHIHVCVVHVYIN